MSSLEKGEQLIYLVFVLLLLVNMWRVSGVYYILTLCTWNGELGSSYLLTTFIKLFFIYLLYSSHWGAQTQMYMM